MILIKLVPFFKTRFRNYCQISPSHARIFFSLLFWMLKTHILRYKVFEESAYQFSNSVFHLFLHYWYLLLQSSSPTDFFDAISTSAFTSSSCLSSRPQCPLPSSSVFHSFETQVTPLWPENLSTLATRVPSLS